MRSLAKRLGVPILIAVFLSAAAPQPWPAPASPSPPGAQQLHAAHDDAPAALRPAPLATAALASDDPTPRGAPEGTPPPTLPATAQPQVPRAALAAAPQRSSPAVPARPAPGGLRSRGPPAA